MNHRPRRFGESKYGIGNRAVRRLRGSPRRALDEGPAAPLRGRRGPRRRAGAPADRVLLVGLGRWGEKHLRVLSELGVDLWVADLSAERRAFAVKAGVAAGPRGRGFPPGAAARGRGGCRDAHRQSPRPGRGMPARGSRHCFVEKPLALTVAEGRRSPRSSAATGRVLQVGHIFRFHPVTTALRDRLAAGALGPVRYCTGRFAGFKRPRTDVGVTQTDAIHYFDLFAYLLGRAADRGDGHPPRPAGSRDGRPLVLRGGVRRGARLRRGRLLRARHLPRVRDRGRAGDARRRLRLLRGGRPREWPRQGRRRWQAPEGTVHTLKATGPEPLRRELELFLDAARNGWAPAVDVAAGLTALEVVEAAHRSSALGRRVTLAELP